MTEYANSAQRWGDITGRVLSTACIALMVWPLIEYLLK
jgi:hypothetical protein